MLPLLGVFDRENIPKGRQELFTWLELIKSNNKLDLVT